MIFTDEQGQRYARHFVLKELGQKGQEQLLNAKVLVVGTGGLGSPAAFYLAAAGVGTLGLVDDDLIDLSNLQRQILHTTEGVGTPKTQSALERLNALNPDVRIVTYQTRIQEDNVMEIIRDYDLVICAVDNFPTRFLLNDACVLLEKPMVEAGVLRFDGMVTTIIPHQGHCYRCVFQEAPPPGAVPTGAETGIIGSVAGVLGVLQATEAIKVITGIGATLKNRLLIYDAMETRFREIAVQKNPKCSACGEKLS